MTDHFAKRTKERQRPSKLKRDLGTGKFEGLSPLSDPALMDQCVRWVRAINELMPVLRALAGIKGDSEDDRDVALAGDVTAAVLKGWREALLSEMSLDQVAVRDATKPELRAVRRRRLRTARESKGGAQ